MGLFSLFSISVVSGFTGLKFCARKSLIKNHSRLLRKKWIVRSSILLELANELNLSDLNQHLPSLIQRVSGQKG